MASASDPGAGGRLRLVAHVARRLATALRRIPVHPFLFAAYGVLYLYAENVGETSPEDALPPLVLALAGAGALMVVGAAVFRHLPAAALVASATTIIFFGAPRVAAAIRPLGLSAVVQLAGWGLVLVLAALAGWRVRHRLGNATVALNVAGLVLVAMSLARIVPFELSRGGQAAGTASEAQIDTPVAPSDDAPDIYYLIFDRYGSIESLRINFGITENPLPAWLESRGFFVGWDTLANYANTRLSLASSLNMRYLDELPAQYGEKSEDWSPVDRLIADHAVGKLVKDAGYRYIQIPAWFGPTSKSVLADEIIRWSDESEFSAVFQDSTALSMFRQVLAASGRSRFEETQYRISLFQFQQLADVSARPGPKFVFVHFLLPHPPYLFDADGDLVSKDELASKSEAELFEQQLAFTNAKIQEAVDVLLSRPGPEPIIVIQADEGPHARLDIDWRNRYRDRLLVRHSILNAYYLPGDGRERLYGTISPVNTFRLIGDEYLGADLPLLPDRAIAWGGPGAIYTFKDFTDLLRQPAATQGADD